MAMAATTPVLRPLERVRRDVALELVDDHFPLTLVRWVGHIQPQHVLRMIRFHDQAVERGLQEGKRIVHICDARDAALPNQLVRDMLVDWLAERSSTERDVTLASYVIASDPLIRGVVASLKWATGRGDGIRVVASLDQAVTGACEVLERAGMIVPEVLRIAG
jgi:hypothetical protein